VDISIGLPRTTSLMILAFAISVPMPALAQVDVVVEGRVYDARSGSGIQNAVVTLEGHGSTLSNAQGTFRFRGVEPGDYALRVEGFGYLPFTTSVSVVTYSIVSVPLEAAPLALDSIVVEARTLDFDGRVRDPTLDYFLLDAEVLSDQGHDERTNSSGRFDLDDVFEGAPLHVVIRAFGYLPLDTTFVPDDEERYEFDLVTDPLATIMITLQTRRLEDRAGELLYQNRPALNRAELTPYAGFGTLQSIMELKYPTPILRGVTCVVLDEQWIRTNWRRREVLQNTVPEELERIELLEFPGPRRSFQLRIYTRVFFEELVARNQPLGKAVMAGRVCR
jgi:hypothetical protein